MPTPARPARRSGSPRTRLAVTVLVGLATLALSSCQRRVEPVLPETRYESLEPANVPDHLRGTVLEYVAVFGTTPQLISGYGLVVNLENTGRDDGIPGTVRERLLDNAQRLGIASARIDEQLGDVLPASVLSDPRTAVVRVEGVVPPAARPGQRIDVAVRALPANTTTSLARGRLWLTELYRGEVGPQNPGEQVNQVGRARGPLMLNPVATLLGPDELPGRPSLQGDLRRAVIPDGGESDLDRPLILRLRDPDPRIARIIEERINFHFGRVSGVATARDEALVELRIPVRGDFSRRGPDAWEHFLGVATHLYLRGGDPAFAAAKARELVDVAKNARGDAETLRGVSLAWQGLGQEALTFVVPLLTSDDVHVRYHAAEAAAQIGHRGAAEVLAQIATQPENPYNVAAAEALGQLSPTVANRRMCRDLLFASNAANERVRVAAYRSLTRLGFDQTGVTEDFVNDRFVLHQTPGDGPPIVYVTRSGRPTIAIIGGIRPLNELPRIQPRTLASAFDDRVTLVRRDEESPVRLFQRRVGPRDGDVSPEAYGDVVASPELTEVLLRLGGVARPGERAIRLAYGDIVALLQLMGERGDLVAGTEDDPLQVAVRIQDAADLVPEEEVAPLVPGLAVLDGIGDPGEEAGSAETQPQTP